MGLLKKISDIFSGASTELEEIINRYKEYLEMEEQLLGKAKKGFQQLNNYVIKNIEASIDKRHEVEQIYNAIENRRRDKIQAYKSKLIKPLEKLVMGYEQRQKEFEEAKKAEEKYNDLKKDYEKLKAKAPGEVDEKKLNKAEEKYLSAKETFEKEESEASTANRNFEKEKEHTMRDIVNNIIALEDNYFGPISEKIKQTSPSKEKNE